MKKLTKITAAILSLTLALAFTACSPADSSSADASSDVSSQSQENTGSDSASTEPVTEKYVPEFPFDMEKFYGVYQSGEEDVSNITYTEENILTDENTYPILWDTATTQVSADGDTNSYYIYFETDKADDGSFFEIRINATDDDWYHTMTATKNFAAGGYDQGIYTMANLDPANDNEGEYANVRCYKCVFIENKVGSNLRQDEMPEGMIPTLIYMKDISFFFGRFNDDRDLSSYYSYPDFETHTLRMAYHDDTGWYYPYVEFYESDRQVVINFTKDEKSGYARLVYELVPADEFLTGNNTVYIDTINSLREVG